MADCAHCGDEFYSEGPGDILCGRCFEVAELKAENERLRAENERLRAEIEGLQERVSLADCRFRNSGVLSLDNFIGMFETIDDAIEHVCRGGDISRKKEGE